jgi:hypothetical protein
MIYLFIHFLSFLILFFSFFHFVTLFQDGTNRKITNPATHCNEVAEASISPLFENHTHQFASNIR